MDNIPFQALINLVNFDQKIRSFNEEIIKLVKKELVLQEQKSAVQRDFDHAKKQTLNARKEVDLQELVMKELDLQEGQKKHQLDTLASYKEYQSIKSELDSIHAQQQTQEAVVIDAWNKMENVQTSFKSLQPVYDQQLDQIEREMKEIVQQIKEYEQNTEIHKKERPLLEQRVPQEWRNKYSIMQARVVDPVVPIVQSSCGSCFYQLTGQDTLQARHGGLVQCKSCYRLMFLEDVHGNIPSKER